MLLAAALAVAGCKKENVDGDAAGTETGTAAPRWRQSWKSGFALARLKLHLRKKTVERWNFCGMRAMRFPFGEMPGFLSIG